VPLELRLVGKSIAVLVHEDEPGPTHGGEEASRLVGEFVPQGGRQVFHMEQISSD
jgi:hypothetical protein